MPLPLEERKQAASLIVGAFSSKLSALDLSSVEDNCR